uniref:Uncharacterized protein n=1 Tax=Rhizophora mucronata TaxID=61149 RepID=A0A2P2PHC5_RHIMU
MCCSSSYVVMVHVYLPCGFAASSFFILTKCF